MEFQFIGEMNLHKEISLTIQIAKNVLFHVNLEKNIFILEFQGPQ